MIVKPFEIRCLACGWTRLQSGSALDDSERAEPFRNKSGGAEMFSRGPHSSWPSQTTDSCSDSFVFFSIHLLQ